MVSTHKDPRANALCNDIRKLYNINARDGWIARAHHTNKEIRIGHPDYGTCPDVSSQIDGLYSALDRLGLAESIGYTLTIVT
tara:strand:- start:265 stop:510 length:246 start_codon:yes stop_codon:yes gene_type:complete